MKKKFLTAGLSVFCALVCLPFGGCANDDFGYTGVEPSEESPDIYGPMYEVTYETKEYLVIMEDCNPFYEKEGEQVKIATTILMDADLVVFVNGERAKFVPNGPPYSYWLYTFIMPDEPVHITFDVQGDW